MSQEWIVHFDLLETRLEYCGKLYHLDNQDLDLFSFSTMDLSSYGDIDDIAKDYKDISGTNLPLFKVTNIEEKLSK